MIFSEKTVHFSGIMLRRPLDTRRTVLKLRADAARPQEVCVRAGWRWWHGLGRTLLDDDTAVDEQPSDRRPRPWQNAICMRTKKHVMPSVGERAHHP